MAFRRHRPGSKLPTALARQVTASHLAAAPLRDDSTSWAVITADHLVIVSQDGPPRQFPWDEVERGSWDADERTFTLRWTDLGREDLLLRVPGGVLQGGRYAPVDIGPFARALRQRVEAAIIHSATTTLPSGRAASASVRRSAEGVLYSVTRPAQAQAADSRDAAALRALEHQVRDGVGLPTR